MLWGITVLGQARRIIVNALFPDSPERVMTQAGAGECHACGLPLLTIRACQFLRLAQNSPRA